MKSMEAMGNIKGKLLILALGILIGIGVNYIFSPKPLPQNTQAGKHPQDGHAAPSPAVNKAKKPERKVKFWTCSMHPQVKLPNPGKCPICSMDLIPMYEDEGGGADNNTDKLSLKLDERAQKLAEISTTKVTYRPLTKEIQTVGKIDYDESRVAYVTAWINGRIDKLYADFTGTTLKKGDHLVLLYSPELLSAQAEYLLTLKSLERIKDSHIKEIIETTKSMVEASRNKLILYGITPDEIKQIEARGESQTHLTITAPIGGTVIHKDAFAGKYVKTGDPLYTIADFSRVWLYLDIYEYDLPWIKFGQQVEVTAESNPGEKFSGRIVFVDPFLDEKTRTVKVRVNMENKEGKLKPGMYANAWIKVDIGAGGRVKIADLEGKFICPMHPEIIKDEPGNCPICGMELEPVGGLFGKVVPKSTDIGFKSSSKGILSVPRSAVLDTGLRKLVYVESAPGRYEPREIQVGPQAEDFFPVIAGLKAGEKVVTSGNLLIDSQMQLTGKPSLMFPEGANIDIHAAMGHKAEGTSHAEHKAETAGDKSALGDTHIPAPVVNQIGNFLSHYYRIQESLAQDSTEVVMNERENMENIIRKLQDNVHTIPALHQPHFKMRLSFVAEALKQLKGDKLPDLRKQFKELSKATISLVQDFYLGQRGAKPNYRIYCSMFPGDWLQPDKTVKNPYYGKDMPKCGELVKDWPNK